MSPPKTIQELAAPMILDGLVNGRMGFVGSHHQVAAQFLLALQTLKESLSSVPVMDYERPIVMGGSPSDYEDAMVAVVSHVRVLEDAIAQAFDGRSPREIECWTLQRMALRRVQEDTGAIYTRAYTAAETSSALRDDGVYFSADKCSRVARSLDELLYVSLSEKKLIK